MAKKTKKLTTHGYVTVLPAYSLVSGIAPWMVTRISGVSTVVGGIHDTLIWKLIICVIGVSMRGLTAPSLTMVTLLSYIDGASIFWASIC